MGFSRRAIGGQSVGRQTSVSVLMAASSAAASAGAAISRLTRFAYTQPASLTKGRSREMAKVAVLCWQEIPSAVEVKDAQGTEKVQLSNRFLELIDMIAMRRKLAGTDDYLMQWRKEKQADRDGRAADVARAVADEIEARYDAIREQALASLKE
jgi:hypothetical protein